MNNRIILTLLINIRLYLARNYALTCMYIDFLPGTNTHCNSLNQAEKISEYDECEAKSTPGLEYYQCIYKIYQIPTEQVNLFSKLHMSIIKCKDCEYTHNWKFKSPRLCTDKAEAEYYKTYSDCLLNYINVNKEEIDKRVPCTRNCSNFDNYKISEIFDIGFISLYLKCSYNCYKDIANMIVEFEPKVTEFTNNNEGYKKSNALSKFDSLSSISPIALNFLILLAINIAI